MIFTRNLRCSGGWLVFMASVAKLAECFIWIWKICDILGTNLHVGDWSSFIVHENNKNTKHVWIAWVLFCPVNNCFMASAFVKHLNIASNSELWYSIEYDKRICKHCVNWKGSYHEPSVSFLMRWSFHSQKPWCHDDVIKWKHFLRYWPFVRGNCWVNTHEAGYLRRYRAHYDVTVM